MGFPLTLSGHVITELQFKAIFTLIASTDHMTDRP